MSYASELDLNTISNYEKYPELLTRGENKADNVEIFTPQFTVADMVKTIGNDFVSDITKVILEPSSGDGAFTVYILELRLQTLLKDKTTYIQKSLIALSTIFSIEINESLITKQRNNIYSLLCYYAKENNFTVSEEYKHLAQKIIFANFIWGETNVRNKLAESFFDVDIGWYMPDSYKKNNNTIEFARWNINEDLTYTITFEKGEIG